MATIDARHDGLGRFERVFAPTRPVAERRAAALQVSWEREFQRRQDAGIAACQGEAEARTRAAEAALQALSAILLRALRSDPVGLDPVPADPAGFAEAAPSAPVPPVYDREPRPEDFPRAKLTLATLVRPAALRRRRDDAESKYTIAHDAWRHLNRWRESEYGKALEVHRAALAAWQARETAFRERQAQARARLEALRDGVRSGDGDALAGLCDLQLLALDRPQGFPCFWVLSVADGVATVDYDLPGIAAVPQIKAVKYLPSRAVFDVVVLGEAERQRLYAEAVFQTVLAVLHTLFAAAPAVRAVVFNGWANYVDATLMRPGRAGIVSVTVERQALQAIALDAVDPSACLRRLNATISAKLAAMLA